MSGAALGSLLGLAIGDALGKPTEFLHTAAIESRFGPWRQLPLPEPALVTDDTQMTLALGDAIEDARARDGGALTPAGLAEFGTVRFTEWAASPENNRAPGMTCLRACGDLANGVPWVRASQIGSKGCGANMRVAPLGLVPGLDADTRRGAAQLQSALTHGHPTALAASELTAEAVWLLAGGLEPGRLLEALLTHCAEQRTVYREEWLDGLAERAHDHGREAFTARGWDECRAVLQRVEAALAGGWDVAGDPCAAAGEGWIAEEALAAGLLCFLALPDDPVAAVRRGAVSAGDSDSLACLAGAFAGARHGAAAWPAEWAGRIEYRERLEALGAAWAG